jgi:hypothetical protein
MPHNKHQPVAPKGKVVKAQPDPTFDAMKAKKAKPSQPDMAVER